MWARLPHLPDPSLRATPPQPRVKDTVFVNERVPLGGQNEELGNHGRSREWTRTRSPGQRTLDPRVGPLGTRLFRGERLEGRQSLPSPQPALTFRPLSARLPVAQPKARPTIGRGREWAGRRAGLSDRPRGSGAGHVGGDVSRQFRLVGHSRRRRHFCASPDPDSGACQLRPLGPRQPWR